MKQDSEDKLAHVLEALENPSSFTQEELKVCFPIKNVCDMHVLYYMLKNLWLDNRFLNLILIRNGELLSVIIKNINYSNNNRSGDSFLHCFVFYI